MTASAPRRRPTREETRQRVLAAAETVFTDRGIDAASVDDVAKEAGLTKGAVYSNFRSKSDLVIALMEEHIVERQRAAAEVFDGFVDSGDALREVGKRLVTAIHTDAKWQRLLIAYAVRGNTDPAVRAAMRDRRRELRTALAGMIERVADQYGLTLQFTPSESAAVVLALSNGFAVESSIDPDAVPDDLFGRVLAALVS